MDSTPDRVCFPAIRPPKGPLETFWQELEPPLGTGAAMPPPLTNGLPQAVISPWCASVCNRERPR